MTMGSLSLHTNQPRGFSKICAIFFFLMIGFSMIQSLAVLYATKQLGFSDHNAYMLFATYFAFIFGLPTVGGFIGGRYLGHRLAVVLGAVLAMLGLLFLTISQTTFFYLGLSCFVAGIASLIPNLYVVLGRLYNKDDYRRDSGFTLSYIAMNLGGFIAMTASGIIVNYVSYSLAFLIGAGSLLITFLIALLAPDLQSENTAIKKLELTVKSRFLGVIALAAEIPIIFVLLKHAEWGNTLLLITGAVVIGIVMKITVQEKAEERRKLWIFLILSLIAVVFWALYMLSPTVLTLFIDRNVDRHIGSWSIPASSVPGLNPFFIVFLGLALSVFWTYAAKRGVSPSLPAKFAAAILLMGSSYLVLMLGIDFAHFNGYSSIVWIVFSYFLQTAGELFLSPIGYSMVGTLVPQRHEGFMMGIWQLTTGIGSGLSGYLADLITTPKATNPLTTNGIYAHSFALFGFITVGIGILVVLLTPKLKSITQQQVRV